MSLLFAAVDVGSDAILFVDAEALKTRLVVTVSMEPLPPPMDGIAVPADGSGGLAGGPEADGLACRYCGSPVGEGTAATLACGDPECAPRGAIACTERLGCGHLCGGVRGEEACLPCLDPACAARNSSSRDAEVRKRVAARMLIDCCFFCLRGGGGGM